MSSIETTSPDERTVIVSAIVAAPVERVFRAFTTGDELARWWWPASFGSTYAVEPRVGGRFSVRAESPQLEIDATFREVSPRRLRFDWRWGGDPDTSEVTIELVPLGTTRTEVVVTHSGNTTPEARDGHGQGWRDCLGRLTTVMSQRATAGAGRGV